MTDKKISELSIASTLTGVEMVEVVQNSVNVRTTSQAIVSLGGGEQTYKFLYSFALDGGNTGTLVLRSAAGALPSGLIFTFGWLDVVTPLGSAGLATAALATPQTAEDLLASTAYSASPWSLAGISATMSGFKMTASRNPTLTIAGANLNAGVFNLYLQGIQT